MGVAADGVETRGSHIYVYVSRALTLRSASTRITDREGKGAAPSLPLGSVSVVSVASGGGCVPFPPPPRQQHMSHARVLVFLFCAARGVGGLLVAHDGHARRVAAASAQLAASSSSCQSSGVKIVRSGSNRVPNGAAYKKASRRLDLSDMSSVLEVRADASPCVVVEPMCSMEKLVRATMAKGLLPKVVPEFKEITVGGAIMGGAMESSSHRHGMFHDTVQAAECLLANGTIVVASRAAEHSELLAYLGGSYGTLCVLTAATIECERAFPYVHLRLRWYDEVDDGLEALVRAAQSPNAAAFIDGVVLPAPASGYLLVQGTFVEEEEPGSGKGQDGAVAAAVAAGGAQLLTAGARPWDEWFYEFLQRAGERLSAVPAAAEETYTMSTQDYLFRFDRGAFNFASAGTWMSSWRDFVHPTKLPLYLASANAPLPRAAFGWFFATAVWQPILHLAPPAAIASQFVLQDCFVPAASAAAGVAAARRAASGHLPAAACPIWTWPVRGASSPLAPNGHRAGELFVNLGIYSRCADGSAAEVTRRLEAWVTANGGRKLLYSNNYYWLEPSSSTRRREGEPETAAGDRSRMRSRADLWKVGGYGREGYDAMRLAYGAEGVLPRLEDKVLTGAEAELGVGPGAEEVAWDVRLARFLL